MILFIDDESHKVQEYEKSLREFGFEVTRALDADEGIEKLLKFIPRIDAVILDIMMPPPILWGDTTTNFGMHTGLKVLERIREETADTPVMVLTNANRSSFDLSPYAPVEFRAKVETPPFVLPKLIRRSIDEARRNRILKQNEEKDSPAVVFQGPVHAQQLYVGNQGTQTSQANRWSVKEEVVTTFFGALEETLAKCELTKDDWESAARELAEVKSTFSCKEPDRVQVAAAVTRFAKLAPWAKARFGELIMGASGSILGAGIVEGVKFAFGMR